MNRTDVADAHTNFARRVESVHHSLEAAGQSRLLNHLAALDDDGRQNILTQIESVDWSEIAGLIDTHVRRKPVDSLPAQIEPAPWYPHQPGTDLREKYAEAHALGVQLVRGGKVAAFTVAGGQGTRLGWNAPKGSFPATPIRRLPLFACLAEFILKIQQKYQAAIRWYIMTSPTNDADTRDIFEQNDYFGIDRDRVMFFSQAMMPAFDRDSAQVLLAARDSLALSPNGHGGSLKALHTGGAVSDMKKHGIEHISYTQIDNPLVRVVDPLFVGLHALDGAQMSSKSLPKVADDERVGNFCLIDGKVTIIEYSDLPCALREQRSADGNLRFRAGSIAVHVIGVDFVEALNQAACGFALPYHRAEKTVPYFDLTSGETVTPSTPNAVKLEMFVFDALPMCDTSIVYETDRVDEFAPIKNANGTDCPSTSSALQIERAARWLEQKGVTVPRRADGAADAVIEISHRTAIEPDDLDNVELPRAIERGKELLL